MISAHGARVTLDAGTIAISYSPLAAALCGRAADEFAVADITDIELTEPTAYCTGTVTFRVNDAPRRVIFAPHQEELAATLAQGLIDATAHRHLDPALGLGASPADSPAAPQPVAGLDFVAVDVETANGDWGSICQVGAVRVIDGIEQDSASWLCQPPAPVADFAPANVAIHHITADDVRNAPAFAAVLPELVAFVGELPLVAHNAQFDATALWRAGRFAAIAPLTASFGCSLALSRAVALDVANHRLPTVAAALGVALDRHHDAAADARACAGIVAELARREHYAGDLAGLFHALGFALGTLTQERVFPVLRERLEQSQPAESRRRPAPAWQAVATPDEIPEPNEDADRDNPLFGQHVTLSGEFEPYDKGRLWHGIAQLGGQVGKNVTKKTTILVAGAWQTKTSKQKRAEELMAKGQPIDIWSADQLFSVLGLEAEPPF